MTDIIAGVFNNALGFFNFLSSVPSILSNFLVGVPTPLLSILGTILAILIAYRIISLIF